MVSELAATRADRKEAERMLKKDFETERADRKEAERMLKKDLEDRKEAERMLKKDLEDRKEAKRMARVEAASVAHHVIVLTKVLIPLRLRIVPDLARARVVVTMGVASWEALRAGRSDEAIVADIHHPLPNIAEPLSICYASDNFVERKQGCPRMHGARGAGGVLAQDWRATSRVARRNSSNSSMVKNSRMSVGQGVMYHAKTINV
ncbi:hypothetical protein B0H17DRAFT_254133 [Mycena rosella]|uniref:Uncharacterized protein n=1 Tax=Mycena rosella TaxID=1033263 RepID=A0AAD7CX60_MYCRO|nr:hypothetical protein B0H17DRAFT_254133 [Mycena rosella]